MSIDFSPVVQNIASISGAGLALDDANRLSPALTAKTAPWMRNLLSDPAYLDEQLQNLGSPLHLVARGELSRNATDMLAVLKERELSGGLYFARKANKLPGFVSEALDNGLGIDTASLAEVEETLALGAPPERVVVTAIGKDHEMVELSIARGCLLVADNWDELELILALARQYNKTAILSLRFSGFESESRVVHSRFGFCQSEATALLRTVAQNREFLLLDGLHAHLDKYDVEERASAARRLIEIADEANEMGMKIAKIDLGGGILMRYLDSESQWLHFLSELERAVKKERPSFIYGDNGLGLELRDNRLVGEPNLYPAWNKLSKERFIAAVLDSAPQGRTLARELRERHLSIYFEPGRSLLDNTGMTIARVMFRKRDTRNNILIGLSMNRTQLRPFRAEFPSDPIFVPVPSKNNSSRLVTKPELRVEEGCYLVGCLCSESDFIYQRKLELEKIPQVGDIACFINTAGYLAHHMEIGTHGGPLPNNLLLDANDLVESIVSNTISRGVQ